MARDAKRGPSFHVKQGARDLATRVTGADQAVNLRQVLLVNTL